MKLLSFGRVIPGSDFSMKRKLSLALMAATCLVLASAIGGWQSLRAGAAGVPGIPGLPSPDHVVVVVEENHGYSEIIGSSAAPYINSLAQQGALFTSSYAIEHPSEPNYLDLFSGSNQGVHDDSCPHTFSTANLGNLLIDAGLSFVGYSEDLPSPGSQVCTSGAYARKHNPWVNFTNVPTSSNLPYTSFPSDYNNLSTVSWVIPNLDNDMHDGSIQQGDAWLQQHIGSYASWAGAHNSLLILTWDEDDSSGGNRIATIMLGPMVSHGSYSETINHYNILRTVEDMYDLPHAGQSGNVQPITDIWTTSLSTGTSTPTGTPTQTNTSTSTATDTGTPTDMATSTDISTVVFTDTPVPTESSTTVTSDTPFSTDTPRSTEIATSTSTSIPDLTVTPTPRRADATRTLRTCTLRTPSTRRLNIYTVAGRSRVIRTALSAPTTTLRGASYRK